MLTDAAFLRKYDMELLQEMKGIADGAAAAGAKWDGRRLDLLDIVTINSDIEVSFLEKALEATPTGIDAQKFRGPQASPPLVKRREMCSAFVATSPATDKSTSGVMLGHITMSELSWVYHINIWLDVTPTKGHRFVCQTIPGGIQSVMDYYISASGLLVAETTIDQTSFDPTGESETSRIRRAVQYANSIDEAASENPWNDRFSVVIFAGLSPRATHRIVDSLSPDEETSPQVVIFPAHRNALRLTVLPP